MLGFLQVITIGGMVLLTFLIYQALGPKRSSLLISKQEKKDWDVLVERELGSWLTGSNIFATITSLATVYIFFIGNTYFFGGWVFAAVITLLVGGYVTNAVTRAVLRRPDIAARICGDDQSASVFLALFRGDDIRSQRATRVIKYITVLNIAAILWMDFAVFADVSSRLIANDDFVLSLILLGVCGFSVMYFTLKYGLRGFVFADLFQSPLIVFGTLVLLIGSVIVIGNALAIQTGESDYLSVFSKLGSVLGTPAISPVGGILFVISCLFLNSFILLVTPPHWLRMWVFGDKEIRLQIRSLVGTCAVWTALILVGALASIAITLDPPEGTPGSIDVVVYFLRRLTEDGSYLFAVAFWIAGMAALFASADVQIYSLWLLKNYEVSSGRLDPDARMDQLPFLYSGIAAIAFTLVYGVVRYYQVPFDRLVFVLLPSCLAIVPSLVLAIRGVRQTQILPLVAITAYAGLSAVALLSDQYGEEFAVAAPIAPLLISVVALFWPKGASHGETT